MKKTDKTIWYVGVDLGLANTGIACSCGETKLIRTGVEQSTMKRIWGIINTCDKFVHQHNCKNKYYNRPIYVVEEIKIFGRKQHLVKTLYLYGAWLYHQYCKASRIVTVAPNEWMRILGRGKNKTTSKKYALNKGYKNINTTNKSNDHTADAACLIEWCRQQPCEQ